MTIKLTGNTLGGIIEANGTPVANVTSAQGFPFCKNKLFNGEVTRINQRGFDGNWAAKNTWAGGNTIAQQELCYGYDMWAKASATDMVQPIEAGNFRPSTVHTISGQNMTTRQETSPASGNWNIVVPQAARNVQVEEGSVATPFEIRPTGFELAQCQRYYEVMTSANATQYSTSAASMEVNYSFKRGVPDIQAASQSFTLFGTGAVSTLGSPTGQNASSVRAVFVFTFAATGAIGRTGLWTGTVKVSSVI